MARDELAALRRELARHEKGRGKRYPADLKRRVTAYALRERNTGVTYESCMGATGGEERAPMLVPVEVVTEARSPIAIISPSGFRLEGLEPAEAVAALRALG